MKMKSLGKQILLKQKQKTQNKTKKMPAGDPAGVSFCFSGIMLLKRPAAGVKDMESGMKINAICFETRNQRQNETSCLTE